MRIIIGVYAYLTKLAMLELKKKLKIPFNYVRDRYDYLSLEPEHGTRVKFTQDGLCYIETNGTLDDIPKWTEWLNKHILAEVGFLDDEDVFYKSIFEKKPHTVIIIPEKEKLDRDDTFTKLGRVYDYSIKAPKLAKEYGDGLVIFRDVKLSAADLIHLIEYQIILSDYQNLIRCLLDQNKEYWGDISRIRKQDKYIFKEIPELIDGLLDKRRTLDSVLHRIDQLDETMMNRSENCPIMPILKTLKLDDFPEMLRLNAYILEQFKMTRDYISSTIELIDILYKENEQKELNLLQVIFAIGTIANLVALAGVSNDQITFTQENGQYVGYMSTFDPWGMLYWTAISIVIGILAFVILNYVFLHAKKLRIVQLTKIKRKK